MSWRNDLAESLCQVYLEQDPSFSFEILSPSLPGWLLPPGRLPPGKVACPNCWHHGAVGCCPLPYCFGLTPATKESFFRAWPLVQEDRIFQLPDHRRRNSYDKAVQKIAMINHIKWFFITANTWLLGWRPKLIDIIFLKSWQHVALLVSSCNTSSNVKYSPKTRFGLMYNYLVYCRAFSCVLFNCLVIYRI